METLAQRRSVGMVGVLLLLTSLIVAIGLPAVADTTNPAVWDGKNGADNLPCTGSLLWIFTGPNAPTLVLDGVSYPGTQQGNGSWHYLTPGANVTVNSSASVVWSGDQGNYVLTISHCDEDTSSTTPSTSPSTSSTSSTTPSTTSSTTPSTTASTTASTSSTASTTAGTSVTQGTTTTTAVGVVSANQSTASTAGVTVSGIQVTLPEAAQVSTQETLPFTGPWTPGMAALAAALAAGGVLLLMASRQTEEKAPVRDWN